MTRLDLTRPQILAFRRQAGETDRAERMRGLPRQRRSLIILDNAASVAS
jgi:hypothetical protein